MQDPRFPKFVVLVNGLVPVALLGWDAGHRRLGANPAGFALLTTGMTALVFLVLSLAVTPLRKATGWNYFSHFRRLLGLFAFFYGVLHFVLYFAFHQGWSVRGTLDEVRRRPFILLGMACLTLMLPLAATSTTGMIKRLGAKNWKRLHRLVYVAAVAGVAHYYLYVKIDTRRPRAFAVVLAFLLAYRVVLALRTRKAGAARAIARA